MDRLVSWYALIGKTLYGTKTDIKYLQDPESDHWKKFDSFLESWSKLEFEYQGVTKKKLSQYDQISDKNDQLLVQEIGRFENFTEDAQRLLSRIDLTFKPETRKNSSWHYHYSHYYSDYGRELVAHAYPNDVHKLNYHFQQENEIHPLNTQ